jgi:tRNA (guanine37-N1)-methyltransferase
VEWRGARVPDVLMSGHHSEIEKWRRKEGLRRTMQRRPDLLNSLLESELSQQDTKLLAQLREEHVSKS